MDELNRKGALVGIVMWVVALNMLSSGQECLIYGTCKADNSMLFAVTMVGLLVPAGLIAYLVSIMTKK